MTGDDIRRQAGEVVDSLAPAGDVYEEEEYDPNAIRLWEAAVDAAREWGATHKPNERAYIQSMLGEDGEIIVKVTPKGGKEDV